MSRHSDEIRAVRYDMRSHRMMMEAIVDNEAYTKALDAEVARLEAENPRLAARYGMK